MQVEKKLSTWLLKAPIAKENLTADEAKALKENGTQVYVNSEYVRLHETKVAPYIANARTKYGETMTGKFADEVQTDGEGRFYVHYHDSPFVHTNHKPTT